MAKPRYETRANKGAKTWQQDVFKAAKALGTPMMPWQRKATRLLAELSPDLCSCHDPARFLPRYKTTVASVPRQQGKTVLSRASITAKSQSDPYLDIFGTAQSRGYAAKHVMNLGETLQRGGDDAGFAPSKVLRGIGAEGVYWPNGSTYLPISPTEGGGHGDSIDFMLVDEGWKLVPHVMGGIRPAMIARPHSQMLIISTMGTVESYVWNSIVARGRESVEDADSTTAYLEYSAEHDEDVFDESKWASWMPALGYTVTREDIRTAIEDVEPSEAIRAFGNRTVKALVSIWPAEWLDDAWSVIQPPERLVVAVDVNDEPPGASVSTGHIAQNGQVASRVVEWRYGSPSWVPNLIEKMVEARQVEAVVADFGGPAREVRTELQAVCDGRGVALVDRTPRDLAADTGRFYDGLRERSVALEKSAPLLEAIEGSARKNLGDMWVISRRQMITDASPIISVILAHGMAVELNIRPLVESFLL